MNEPVVLVEHDPEWETKYELEEDRFLLRVTAHITSIYHIGSTAVPGLKAKPIIDLMVGVKKFKPTPFYAKLFAKLGYTHDPNVVVPDRIFFYKGAPREYHLHLVEQGSETMERHLWFRDILLSNTAVRDEYERLKLELAETYRDNREAYAEAKTEFVQRALRSRI